MKVVPMVPREIVLDMVQLSPLTLRATWKRPSRTYGALKGYKFSWGPQGEVNQEYEIQGPANIFVAEVSGTILNVTSFSEIKCVPFIEFLCYYPL